MGQNFGENVRKLKFEIFDMSVSGFLIYEKTEKIEKIASPRNKIEINCLMTEKENTPILTTYN